MRNAGAVVVALIFNTAAMEKTIPLYPLTVPGEEELHMNKFDMKRL